MVDEHEVAGLGGGKRRPGCMTVVLLAALTSVVASAATTWALQRYGLEWTGLPTGGEGEGEDEAEEKVSVPSVNGLSLDSARAAIESHDLRIAIDAEEPHDSVEAGHVSAQRPAGGTPVRPGTDVKLIVSRGAGEVTVPEVVGKPVGEAESALEEAGLSVGKIDRSAEEGEPGTVTTTDPAPGTKVERDSSVALTTTPGGVVVPKVVGKRYRDAREALEEAGLEVGGVRRIYDERRGPHVVLRQGTDADRTVASGTEIDLVVNQGE